MSNTKAEGQTCRENRERKAKIRGRNIDGSIASEPLRIFYSDLATVFSLIPQFQWIKSSLEDLEDFGDRLSSKTALSSLKKDASCLLRMYAKQSSNKTSVAEDSLDCPFVELGLIYPTGDNRHYTFHVGYKPSLVPEIILYAALHFACQVNESARTIPLGSLLYDQGSPGKVFKLTESAICAAIEILAKKYNVLKLEDAAGKLQFSFETDEPLVLAENILENYYTAQ